MREVQHPGAHQRRRPIRRHIGQADRQGRHRRIDLDVDDDLRDAQDLERVREGLRRVGRAIGLVGPEVARQAVRRIAGTPRQRAARAGRRAVPEGVDVVVRRPAVPQRAGPEQPCHGRRRGVRVGGCSSPPPGERGRERLGCGVLVLEPDDRRLVVPPVIDAVEVAVEEARDLVQLVEVGPRRSPSAATSGPSCRPACATATDCAACIRNAGSTYESCQPPMLKIGTSMAS